MERNKFVVLEDYELITVFTPAHLAEQLQLITRENPLFKELNWKTIRVAVSNQHFTLVPETLFDPTHQQDYLRLHSNLNPQLDDVPPARLLREGQLVSPVDRQNRPVATAAKAR